MHAPRLNEGVASDTVISIGLPHKHTHTWMCLHVCVGGGGGGGAWPGKSFKAFSQQHSALPAAACKSDSMLYIGRDQKSTSRVCRGMLSMIMVATVFIASERYQLRSNTASVTTLI